MSPSTAPVQHAVLVRKVVEWLRRNYRCGIILSEQYCATGEVPDAIGWKGQCRSEKHAFVYSDRETGRVTTILGYPTNKIAQAG